MSALSDQIFTGNRKLLASYSRPTLCATNILPSIRTRANSARLNVYNNLKYTDARISKKTKKFTKKLKMFVIVERSRGCSLMVEADDGTFRPPVVIGHRFSNRLFFLSSLIEVFA